LKTPRPKLGCSTIEGDVKKKTKRRRKKIKKKNSLITKLIAITFQLPS